MCGFACLCVCDSSQMGVASLILMCTGRRKFDFDVMAFHGPGLGFNINEYLSV